MLTEFEQGLREASIRHQQFIQMTAVKEQGLDTQRVAQLVQEAENIYIELLNQDIQNPTVAYQLATLYLQTNRNSLAIWILNSLVEHGDARIEVLNNLGAAYRNEHYNKEARGAFEKALSVEYHPDVLANLAALWVNEGDPAKGIGYGKECMRLEPGHKQGIWNTGLLLLENKEYEEGFYLYSKGFYTGDRMIRSYKDASGKEAVLYDGQDISGKTMVLHGEQGIGDELLFMQFVIEFMQRHPSTQFILDVHPRLHSAIQRSINAPNLLAIFPTRKSKETPEWNAVHPVDFKDGMGSLGRYCYEARGKHSGWLKPDPERVAAFKERIHSIQKSTGMENRPVVGIAWSGGRKKTRYDLRSIPLGQWSPILEQDCTFVSLEYWDGADKQAGDLYKDTGLLVHHWPDVVQNFDYEDSMALAAACDLVICVNTSIVHVQGSAGNSCWTLTPHGHAWRYGLKDKMNPFYNTVVQYHQSEEENWDRIIRQVAEDLKRFARKHK